MPRSHWLIASSMLALPACVSYVPEPLRPLEALQQLRKRAETDVALDHAGPWQADWFPLAPEVHIGDGLTLDEANTLALFYGPKVRAARAHARVAGAQVLQAGVLANPQLFLGPRLSTRDSSLIFPASIAWSLPIWGEESAARSAAEARLTRDLLVVIEIELDALQRVRTLFLRLGRLQREEQVLAAATDASRLVVEWIEALARAREADDVAVYLARTERDDALAALDDVRTEVTGTRREILAELGMLPEAPVTFVVDGAAVTLPALPAADRDALVNVPALRAAEAEYAVAEAGLKLEISKQYPGVQFGPEFENDRGEATIGLGLQIELPLFDRNRGGIAAAEEGRARARESYTATLLASAHAAAAAREGVDAAERQQRIHREGAWRNADQTSRALDSRLRAGRAGVVEVLAAQRAIARAHTRMIELEEQAAVARLHAAVAGGLALQRPVANKGKETEK